MSLGVKGKKVLVTGGAGFIGSHLCRRLVLEGARVHVLIRPQTNRWRLDDVAADLEFHPADLTQAGRVSRVLAGIKPDIVFHFAACVDVSRDQSLWPRTFQVNVGGLMNLAKACGSQLRLFVNAGTCEEYGTNRAPFHEAMREDPVSPYSLSKVMASHACLMLHRSHGFPAVVVRPFLTYGPMQSPGQLIPSLIEACLRGTDFKMTPGLQTREFNYVDDIVDGVIAVTKSPQVVGEVINIGNGKEITIKKAAELVRELTGSKIHLRVGAIPYRPGEAMHFYADVGKIKRLTGWRARTDLRDGLTRTIAWAQNHLK